jgi:2-dehydro-3-deoxygalactonokinase
VILGIDWGTSSLRGALLADDGGVLDATSVPRGILSVPPGGFRAAFDQVFGAWHARAALTLVCGMAGSRQGWLEAPYCACPADFAGVARSLAWIEPGRIALVPGLSCEHEGVPDVMRGEETQVLGAMRLLELRDAQVVLPGTHSKWVQLRGGRIETFRTFMTGECYALLRRHSILARTLPDEDGQLDEDAFRAGLAQARRSGSLLAAAFSVRTLALFDRMPAQSLASYLSGLVIGEELRVQPAVSGAVIVAAPALACRYAIAIPGARVLGDEATWQGLRAIARSLAT